MVPKVVCSGNPGTFGLEYGLQCQELIANWIAEVEQFIRNRLLVDPEPLFERAQEYFQLQIAKAAPHLWQEILSLAEACEQPLAKIIFLQTIPEFASGVFPENTLLAVNGPATKGGNTLVGVNLDFPNELIDRFLVVREIRPEYGPKIMLLSVAGALGLVGVNDRGLTAASCSLESSGIQKGLPATILIRLALEKTNLSAMVNLIKEATRATARNYLLADKQSCLNLETTISASSELGPDESGVLVHTNHYLSSGLCENDLALTKWPESPERYQRCLNLLQDKAPLSATELAETLADHVLYPKGICRHEQDGVKGARTFASLIVSTTEPSMLVCPGSPCRGKFDSFNFTAE